MKITILIFDANTIIDLYYGEIIENISQLTSELIIPDFVATEIKTISDLSVYGFHIKTFKSKEINSILELYQKQRANSVADISVIFTAELYNKKKQEKQVIVITGDRNLKKLAEKHGIEVHGALWVLDELVKNTILTGKEVIKSLDKMLDKGARFPEDEWKKLKSKWKN